MPNITLAYELFSSDPPEIVIYTDRPTCETDRHRQPARLGPAPLTQIAYRVAKIMDDHKGNPVHPHHFTWETPLANVDNKLTRLPWIVLSVVFFDAFGTRNTFDICLTAGQISDMILLLKAGERELKHGELKHDRPKESR